MSETHTQFIQRLRRMGLSRQHGPNERVALAAEVGVLGVVPKHRTRRSMPPLRGLVLVLGGFVGLKALMLASVGPVTYKERLAKLESGTVVEWAGAKLMAIDPVTEGLARFTGPVLR